jgi:hypothetical protein
VSHNDHNKLQRAFEVKEFGVGGKRQKGNKKR